MKRQQKDDIEKLGNEQGEIPDHLKKRKIVQINPQYQDIENAVVSFVELARERGMSGKREATKRGINNFKASEGWLDKVKKRHGIVGKNLSEEAAAVDKILVKNWMEELPDILKEFEMKDVFNCDETGLIFKQATKKSLVRAGDSGHGKKVQKERLTVLICCSWMGEKEKLLMIGKAVNPRALKGANFGKLPVIYRSQKSAWMTGRIFEEWLRDFDCRMNAHGRNVLLTMDNAGVHNMRDIPLKAVKLVYFPKNTTSCTQPCDAGIIQALKLKYKEQLHNHILGSLSSEQTADDDPLKAINIALVMVWIFRAWKKVEKRTISKCFANRGFLRLV